MSTNHISAQHSDNSPRYAPTKTLLHGVCMCLPIASPYTHVYLHAIIHACMYQALLAVLLYISGVLCRWEREQKMMHNLQVCVGFAPKLPHIHIAVPGRILVKEGEATLIEKKRKRKASLILIPSYHHISYCHVLILPFRRCGFFCSRTSFC